MDIILELHRFLSTTIWIFFLALGLWGLFRAWRRQGLDSSYLGAAAIGELLFIIQALLGFIRFFENQPGRPAIHVLYGVFAIVFMPFVYFVWLKGDESNRAMWVMGLVTLFLFGVSLRAISTGV